MRGLFVWEETGVSGETPKSDQQSHILSSAMISHSEKKNGNIDEFCCVIVESQNKLGAAVSEDKAFLKDPITNV